MVLCRADDSLKGGRAHTTVPQQAAIAAAAGPWVACLAPACSPGQGTHGPWLAELSALATTQLKRPPPALPNALYIERCITLPAQPQCACCAWLAGKCWAQALRLQAVWLPGCCLGAVGACVGPLPGTTSCPAPAVHAAGYRLGEGLT
ncbi:hypothetical protein HaLaN_00379, partial [Haematococcus lacustris]